MLQVPVAQALVGAHPLTPASPAFGALYVLLVDARRGRVCPVRPFVPYKLLLHEALEVRTAVREWRKLVGGAGYGLYLLTPTRPDVKLSVQVAPDDKERPYLDKYLSEACFRVVWEDVYQYIRELYQLVGA